MPVGVTAYRQRAIYHLTFWRGEILTIPEDNNLKCCSSKCCESGKSRAIEPCRLYIEVAFAGLKVRHSLCLINYRLTFEFLEIF